VTIFFDWLPISGARHAVFCERTVSVPQVEPNAEEWLWPTCLPCYDATKSDGYRHTANRLNASTPAAEDSPDDVGSG